MATENLSKILLEEFDQKMFESFVHHQSKFDEALIMGDGLRACYH